RRAAASSPHRSRSWPESLRKGGEHPGTIQLLDEGGLSDRAIAPRLTVVLDPQAPVPRRGRTYSSRRRLRLSDLDERGRLRLAAIARFLHDVAIDAAPESGLGIPAHGLGRRRHPIAITRPF